MTTCKYNVDNILSVLPILVGSGHPITTQTVFTSTQGKFITNRNLKMLNSAVHTYCITERQLIAEKELFRFFESGQKVLQETQHVDVEREE